MASKKPPGGELSVFPHELRPGDRVMVNGVEWEVTTPPAVYLKGKMQTVRLRKPGDPRLTDIQHMPGHERGDGAAVREGRMTLDEAMQAILK